jgi:thioredoxin reductase
VVDGEVRRIVLDEDRLKGVVLGNGRIVERTALFVRPSMRPRGADLLRHLGCATDEHGFVIVDSLGATTATGVWAAGNVANPRAQVITAAGEGSAAAIAINADLVQQDVREAPSRPNLRPKESR